MASGHRDQSTQLSMIDGGRAHTRTDLNHKDNLRLEY